MRLVAPVALALFALGSTAAAQPAPTLQATLAASDGDKTDQFGYAVAISGGRAVIGARYDDTSGGAFAGSAYVFALENGTWAQVAKLTAPGVVFRREFGSIVSLSGDRLLIGGRTDPAYVFVREGGSWILEAELVPDTSPGNGVTYISSLALSGDRALLGVAGAGEAGQGAVFVYAREGGAWMQEAVITRPEPIARGGFGDRVSLSGDRALIVTREVSVNQDGIRAGASIFVRTPEGWVEEANDVGRRDDGFGSSVSLSGDYAIVGAPLAAEGRGGAYVYSRERGFWTHEAILTASNGDQGDRFGVSVSITSEGRAAAGAVFRGNGAGAAYVFSRESDGTWTEEAMLARSTGARDNVGRSVAISDGHVLVGAPAASPEGRFAAGDVDLFALPSPVSTEPPPDGTVTLTAAPNPASDLVQISATLTHHHTVRVEVADVLGRQVALLHDGPLADGSTSWTWSPAALSAGVYVVRLATSGVVHTQRLTLVR